MEIAVFRDNTALFRARIKALKLRQDDTTRKRLRSTSLVESSEEQKLLPQIDQKPIPPTDEEPEPAVISPNFPLYTAHARQICQHIRELADLVLERRKSYLLTSVNVYGHDNFMTDDDRRQFDSDTDLAMKQCSRLVRNLEFQLDNDPSLRKDDEYPHLKAVTLLLNVYLKNVCKIVSELRAVHLKKTQYLNKICRLGNLVDMCGSKINKIEVPKLNVPKKMENVETKRENDIGEIFRSKQFEGEHRTLESRSLQQESADPVFTEPQVIEDDESEVQDIDLNQSEQAQLSIENQHLFERFIQRNSEIEQLEGQFSELQKLQQTFVEKVVEQEKDIEIIHEKTIHTLDNLDQANDFIREAIKNSASRRVIALFCLIVLTFTLLFLDWYNP